MKTLYTVVALLSLGALLLILLAIRPDPAEPAALVEPAATRPGEPIDGGRPRTTDGFLAVVVAKEEVDVAPEIAGRLATVPVNLGDRVRRGEVLATIESEELKQDLEIAKASLVANRAERGRREVELATAQEKHERVRTLRDVVSEQDRADARSAAKLAEAQLDVAGARLSEAEVAVRRLEDRVGRAAIRAPFAGTIAARFRDPGATVAAGEPVVRLISASDLWVRFGMTEDDVSDIRVGDPVLMQIESFDLSVPGVVRRISPESDPMVRRILVEAQLDVPSEYRWRIHAGSVGTVRRASATFTEAR